MKRTYQWAMVLALAVGLCASPAAAYYDYEEPNTSSPGLSDRLYLSFSLGEGAYFNYYCDYDQGCKTVLAAPVDFEILVGVQLVRNLYLDLAVHWAVDYYEGYYSEVTYLTGVRPGLRFFFPGLFNRFFYLRAAVPISYTLDDAKNWLVGFLIGFGIEWRFQQLGLFAEVNLMPYFTEYYPGYYVIPAEGRLGVSVRF